MKKSLDEFERLMKTFPSRQAVTVSAGQTCTVTFSITTFCPRPACKLVTALNVILVLANFCVLPVEEQYNERL